MILSQLILGWFLPHSSGTRTHKVSQFCMAWCNLSVVQTVLWVKCKPIFFANTIRPVLKYLRSINLRLIVYVDDWVLFANRDKIQCHKGTLLDTLEKLGCRVNWTKSSLAPEMSKVWICYILSSTMFNGEPGIKNSSLKNNPPAQRHSQAPNTGGTRQLGYSRESQDNV